MTLSHTPRLDHGIPGTVRRSLVYAAILNFDYLGRSF
jgi:hypothetical protein